MNLAWTTSKFERAAESAHEDFYASNSASSHAILGRQIRPTPSELP